MIDLTEEQKKILLEGEPVRLHVPDIGPELVLLRADTFLDLQEILEDERLKKAFRQAGLKSATRRLKVNPYR